MAGKSASIAWVGQPLVRLEVELQQWGRWERSGYAGLGYGANVLGRLHGAAVPSVSIGDTRALQISAAMARLREHRALWWSALHYAFVRELDPPAWARIVGVHASTAYRAYAPAMNWMLGEVGVTGD